MSLEFPLLISVADLLGVPRPLLTFVSVDFVVMEYRVLLSSCMLCILLDCVVTCYFAATSADLSWLVFTHFLEDAVRDRRFLGLFA